MSDQPTIPTPPSWLTDEKALEEWNRVGAAIPTERLGLLSVYCTVHARLLGLLEDPKTASRAASLIGQYRTLAAALFGNASRRAQPGKNPFAQLRDKKQRRIKDKWVGTPKSGHFCDAVNTSGYVKGYPCGAAGMHKHERKWYCGAHFAKVVTTPPSPRKSIDEATMAEWNAASRRVLDKSRKNYAAAVTGPKPRAKRTKGRKRRG